MVGPSLLACLHTSVEMRKVILNGPIFSMVIQHVLLHTCVELV